MRSQQSHGIACGVYAATYAITKALGKNPAEIKFKKPLTDAIDEALYLRMHLARIVSEGTLSLFPEDD